MTREEQKTNAAIEMYPAGTQNSLQFRVGFATGVEWADEHPKEGLWDAEKVIDWLNSWFTDDICKCGLPITKDARKTFFNDLRKAMEE